MTITYIVKRRADKMFSRQDPFRKWNTVFFKNKKFLVMDESPGYLT
jgi:hypothetical protein